MTVVSFLFLKRGALIFAWKMDSTNLYIDEELMESQSAAMYRTQTERERSEVIIIISSTVRFKSDERRNKMKI